MKRIITVMLLMILAGGIKAQSQQEDKRPFQGFFYNKEYDVYMQINFYDDDVIISWQELLGPVPGLLAKQETLGKKDDNYCWIVTSATIDGKKAELEITNDYGSEDLTATLTQVNDSVFTLKQQSGSTIKVPQNNKWLKLPSLLTFTKRK